MKVKNSPSVFIIILNWNGLEDTVSCINSIERVDYQNYQVLVVDNGSKNEEADRIECLFSRVYVIRNKKNLGFTGGCNVGIDHALEKGADYVLLLNNDTIVTMDFLSELVSSAEREAEVAAVQPKIKYEHQRNMVWNGGSGFSYVFSYPKFTGMRVLDNGQFDKEQVVPWLTGCCMLVKTKVIREVGTLDDIFFAYFEDTDWSFRMREYGYVLLYQPKSVIYHKVAKSQINMGEKNEGEQPPFVHYISMRNHLLFTRKHGLRIFLIPSYLYIAFKLIAYSLYFLSRKRFEKLRSIWKGFFDGLKGSSFEHNF